MRTRGIRAYVPADVTKPKQALVMLQAAWDVGVPMCWVTGDAVYGDVAFFRDGVQVAGRWYVLGVSSTIPVSLAFSVVAVPFWSGVEPWPTPDPVVAPALVWVTVV